MSGWAKPSLVYLISYGGAPPVITDLIQLEAPAHALPLPVRVAEVGVDPTVIWITALMLPRAPVHGPDVTTLLNQVVWVYRPAGV